MIDINLNGSYWMAQACGRVMKPGSSIVNIGSVLGPTTGALPQAAYSSSKAAIIGLTRDLAQQWTGRKGIRVNALAPGFFPSEMTEQYPDGYLDQMMIRVPAGPRRRGRRARRRAALPRQRRLVLRDRHRPSGRRRHADHLKSRGCPHPRDLATGLGSASDAPVCRDVVRRSRLRLARFRQPGHQRHVDNTVPSAAASARTVYKVGFTATTAFSGATAGASR